MATRTEAPARTYGGMGVLHMGAPAALLPAARRWYVARVWWGQLPAGPTMDAAEESDRALVRALATGDREALGVLYDRFGAMLLTAATRALGSDREAEDLVHDVFLEAWHRARHYDPGRGSVRAWLTTRLRSRAIDRLRSRRARGVQTSEGHLEHVPSADPDPQTRADARHVRDAVSTLSDAQRTVLELAYYQGLTMSEIATRLNVPVGTIKSRLFVAVGKLREALGVEPGGTT